MTQSHSQSLHWKAIHLYVFPLPKQIIIPVPSANKSIKTFAIAIISQQAFISFYTVIRNNFITLFCKSLCSYIPARIVCQFQFGFGSLCCLGLNSEKISLSRTSSSLLVKNNLVIFWRCRHIHPRRNPSLTKLSRPRTVLRVLMLIRAKVMDSRHHPEVIYNFDWKIIWGSLYFDFDCNVMIF